MAKLNPFQFTAKNGKKITLRSPEVGEGSKLIETVLIIMQTSDHLLTQADEFKYTPEQEDEMIKNYLAHSDKLIIVPECESKIIGMMDFSVGGKRRNSHAGEMGMSLLPDFRGAGIGREMLNALLSWAKENPRVEKINLRVHAKNASAIRLYKKAGFEEEGREVKGAKLAEGIYDDVILMTCFV